MADEFIILTAGILKEILEDVPDNYDIRFEDCGMSYPVMDYEVQENQKELTLRTIDRRVEE